MDNHNLNVSHLAWCGLIALYIARRDRLITSLAQDSGFDEHGRQRPLLPVLDKLLRFWRREQPEAQIKICTLCLRTDSALRDAWAGMVTDVTGYSEPKEKYERWASWIPGNLQFRTSLNF